NAQERMRGEAAVTQFGRMCAKLGIRIIAASSPQAKGRVERAHGTHQDRLVKKLRLAGIVNYEQANAYLDEHYLEEHNRRYARPAAEEADYHRRRPTARPLDEVFWLEEERVVSEDWVVHYKNRRLQLERQSQHWAPAKSRVLVRENEAGNVATHYRGQSLRFRELKAASKADWEGLLPDLYRRGLEGKHLGLIVTDGCPGLAAAIPTVYPRVRHQRCWVHKMRNILDQVRRRDHDQAKTDAQAIYLAKSRAQAVAAFRRFQARWRREYGAMVRRLERDLPELLSFFAFPRHLWRKLRTTNVIERCFVEVRRRTRPMVCFVNVESVDRIIYSIFQRFNLDWKTRTLSAFTQAA
ncbi:MAG TPA: transposase, partial [Terriglobales bacterium]